MRLRECTCGSGEWPEAQYDGYGIFMCYTCLKCYYKKMKGFRKDIRERYDTDEQIEPE